MAGRFPTQRLPPLVAGVAGLTWFWFELAPQRAGFQDTDSPEVGLAFMNVDPAAWTLAGLALAAGAIALVATVLGLRERLLAAGRAPVPAGPTSPDGAADRPVGGRLGVDTLTVIGLFAAAMLFGMGCVRLSGGPVRYVQGLDPGWGEMAYTVTQFVGVQLLLTGGALLLGLWIAGVAVIGVRRGIVPQLLALLAIVPALRVLAIPGVLSFLPDAFWFVLMASIPGAFLWLVVLSVWPASRAGVRKTTAVTDPVPV